MVAESIVSFVFDWLKALTYAMCALTVVVSFLVGAFFIHVNKRQ